MKKVYLISANIEGVVLYKIGYTKRKVEKRIKELKTGNAANFNIEKVYETDKYGVSIEKALHFQYSSKKIDGEWFNLNNDDIKNFNKMCEKLYQDFEIIEKSTFYQDKKASIK